MSKFHNVKTTAEGITFDSKAEAARYRQLVLLERTGVIRGLKLQPPYEVHPAFTDNEGRKHRKVSYIGDFQYSEGTQLTVEDVKGATAPLTPLFLLKSKLFRARYPGIKFVIVRM